MVHLIGLCLALETGTSRREIVKVFRSVLPGTPDVRAFQSQALGWSRSLRSMVREISRITRRVRAFGQQRSGSLGRVISQSFETGPRKHSSAFTHARRFVEVAESGECADLGMDCGRERALQSPSFTCVCGRER